jgi:hypothetical protein
MRWLGIGSATFIFLPSAFVMFQEALKDSPNTIWLVFVVAFGAEAGCLTLLQSIFPPRLQRGNPDFITLNLGGKGLT